MENNTAAEVAQVEAFLTRIRGANDAKRARLRTQILRDLAAQRVGEVSDMDCLVAFADGSV